MAIKKSAPKRKNQHDTKEKLLKAALDVFSKEGYNAATTRAIAKKAGVNESLIQRYFEGKRGLFFALTHQFREGLLNQFLNYEASGNLEEEFVRFITSRMHTTTQEKKFFRIALTEAILDPKAREDVRSYANKRPPALEARFEKFRKEGQIRADVDMPQMVQVLHMFALSVTILKNALECISEEDADKLIAYAAKILTRGLGK